MNGEDVPRQERAAAGRLQANASRVLVVVVGGTAGYLAGEAVISIGAGPLAGVVAGNTTAIVVEIALESGREWLSEKAKSVYTTMLRMWNGDTA